MTGHDIPPEVQAKVHKADVARNVFWVLVAVWALFVASGIGYTTYETRQTQVSNTGITHDTHATVADVERILFQLEDCLTPGGKCYQASQANQQHILAQVSELQTYHALCIRSPDVARNVSAVDQCVAVLIREHGLG